MLSNLMYSTLERIDILSCYDVHTFVKSNIVGSIQCDHEIWLSLSCAIGTLSTQEQVYLDIRVFVYGLHICIFTLLLKQRFRVRFTVINSSQKRGMLLLQA